MHYETEETKKAEQSLLSSLELQPSVTGAASALSDVIQYMNTCNHLCMIMFEREELESCISWLQRSETLYLDFCASTSSDRTTTTELETTYTSTCFYFAQVYGRLEQTAQSGIYCEKTLYRKYESGVYEAREIAQFCLQIASYYQSASKWQQALYIIAAAYTISKPISDAQLYAEISLFMAKFFVEYFENQQQQQSYLPNSANNRKKHIDTQESSVSKMKGLELDSEFEASQLGAEQIVPLATAALASNWVSHGATWFTRALNHFILDGYTTEHVTICLERDHMLAISLDFFTERKMKKSTLKRRIGFLEPLIKTLSPNHFFQLVQQLYFTCAEIYEHIVDLSEIPLPNGLNPALGLANNDKKERKLNKRVVTAVQYYQNFLDTIMGPNQRLPTHLDEGVIESFFRAHLSLAKLYQRFRSSNKAVLLAMIKKSAEYYKLTDTLARAYKPTILQQELQLCAELHRLLSMKAAAMEKDS